jgi:pimeloyl-ACP methyl ester carboxylesterase
VLDILRSAALNSFIVTPSCILGFSFFLVRLCEAFHTHLCTIPGISGASEIMGIFDLLKIALTGKTPFPADSYVCTKTINGHEIAFTDVGFSHDGPAIVTFSGWNQDHRGWSYVTPYLILKYRVISVCFRGHGPNRDPVEDFGFADHAREVLAHLDDLSVDRFICIAASHGAWPALEIAQMVGRRRMPAVLVLDLAMEPLSPQFLTALKGLQNPETWRAIVLALFKSWGSGGLPDIKVVEQGLLNLGGFNAETWGRAGRTIEEVYGTWGTPLKRMEALSDPPLIHHVYSQPATAEYDALQRRFQQQHPQWFSYFRASGKTHVPHFENPRNVSKQTFALITKALERPLPEQRNGKTG